MRDHVDVDERIDLPGRARAVSPNGHGVGNAKVNTEGDEEGRFAAARGSRALSETFRVAGSIASLGVDPAATRLTDAVLGCNDQDLADTLAGTAAEIGCSHISYVRLSPDKSADTGLLTAVVTYSRVWQVRYFIKQYVRHDPIIAHGRDAVLPFDWATLRLTDPLQKAFLLDARRHNVGHNGLSSPLRNRRGVVAIVSFTSDLPTDQWENYKTNNMSRLRLLSVLIDSAANINFKLPAFPANLSNREEQCLILGGKRKDLSRNWRDPQHSFWQRQDSFGRRPTQTALR
jgi:hypothetical protein